MVNSHIDASADDGRRPRIACFVINLERDRERLENISRSLAAMGIPFKRQAAINGKRHERLIRRMLQQPLYSNAKQRPLTAGEIGCALSHVSVLRRMLREGVGKAIILEDDAQFAPDFTKFHADHLSGLLDRFDIIKMEGIFYDHTSVEGVTLAIAGEARLVLPLRPSLGTAAYAVTARGARRLLQALRTIDDPFDVRFVQYERHRARFVELRPMLVSQDTAPSSLEPDRLRAESLPKSGSRNPVSRARSAFQFLRRASGRLLMWAFWVVENRLAGPKAGARR